MSASFVRFVARLAFLVSTWACAVRASDVSGLRGDVSGLSGDVSVLRGNVSGLSGNVIDLRGDVTLGH